MKKKRKRAARGRKKSRKTVASKKGAAKRAARRGRTAKRAPKRARRAAPKKRAKKRAKRAVRKRTKTAARRRPAAPAKRRRPARAARPRPKPTPAAPAAPVVRPGEIPVGTVIHYYSHLQVAVVKLENGSLAVGDRIHVRGHTTDFEQTVESMEIEHQRIQRAEAGQEFGLKVVAHAREHDTIYRMGSEQSYGELENR